MGMQCSPLELSAVASTEWAITMVANDSEAVLHDLDKEKGVIMADLFLTF